MRPHLATLDKELEVPRSNLKDMTRKRFGSLEVLALLKERRRHNRVWLCKCDCGQYVEIISCNLIHTTSCGHLIGKNIKHGLHDHPLYNVWKGIKGRCYNPRGSGYKNYGGRGIKVCDEWRDFQKFYDWAINNNWQLGLQIDRIDNDGPYAPWNCRFVTPFENSNNKRNNVKLYWQDRWLSKAQFARLVGITPNSFQARLDAGYTLQEAATCPKNQRRVNQK